MLTEISKIFYSGFIGANLLAAVIFFFCWYRMRIKGSEAFFTLSLLITGHMLMNLFVMNRWQVKYGAYHILPFAGFCWALAYYVFYGILDSMFGFNEKWVASIRLGLKCIILLMSILAFFFGIEDFRNLFVLPEINETWVMGYQLTPLGAGIIVAAGFWVFLGNVHSLFEILVKRSPGFHRLLLWGNVYGVVAISLDTFTTASIENFTPLFPVMYFPATLYFLMLCFSSPHFHFFSISEKLSAELPKSDVIFHEDENVYYGEKIYVRGIIEQVIGHLKTRSPNVEPKVELSLSGNFFLRGDRSELTVLFYSLMEKAFDNIGAGAQGSPLIKVVCERLEKTYITIQNSGDPLRFSEDKMDPDRFKKEAVLLAKRGARLVLLRESDLNTYRIEFDGK